MITRHYAHPHGFIAGEEELRSLAEACETSASHYRELAARTELRNRRIAWVDKADRFASLAKNLREILAEG